MEDAMVINRNSLERGFAHGQVYKTEFVDLGTILKQTTKKEAYFERDPKDEYLRDFIDVDGLPYPGVRLNEGDPFYW